MRYGFTDFRGHIDETMYTVVGLTTTVPDLQFNALYSIGVRACTQMPEIIEPLCGKAWAESDVLTGIGSKKSSCSQLSTYKSA